MNRVAAAESTPLRTSSDGTGQSCSSATRKPSRLVARNFTVAERARIASIRSAAASRTCSQLSKTNSRDRPSSAAATDSLTVLPGCWVMPSTAATASGTDAGSVTAASSKTQAPSGNSSASCAATSSCEARLANSAYPGQRHQPVRPHCGLDRVDLGLAPNQARGRRMQVSRRGIERPQRRKLHAEPRCTVLGTPQPVSAHPAVGAAPDSEDQRRLAARLSNRRPGSGRRDRHPSPSPLD